MRARLALGWMPLIALACSSEQVIVAPSLPEDASFYALLYRSEVGPGWEATSLLPVEGPQLRVRVVEPDIAEFGRLTVLAFTDSDLEQIALPDDPASLARPLEPPSMAQVLIPSYSASGPRGASPIHLTLDDTPTPVGIPWIDCPSVEMTERSTHADVHCFGSPCEASFQQSGCGVEIQSQTCNFHLRATVNKGGSLSFSPTAEESCSGRIENGSLTATCDGGPFVNSGGPCEIRVESAPEPPTPAIQVDSVDLAFETTWVRMVERDGFLRGLFPLPEGLLSLRAVGGLLFDRCTSASSELILVDRERLEVLRSWPAPDCTSSYAPIDDEGRVVAVYGRGRGQKRIGIIEPDGQISRSEALPPELFAPEWPDDNLWSSPIMVDAVSRSVAFTTFEGSVDDERRFIVVDLDTLTPRGTITAMSGEVLGPWLVAPSQARVLEDSKVFWNFDLQTGQRLEQSQIRGVCGDIQAVDLVADDPERRWLLTSRGGRLRGLAILDYDRSACGQWVRLTDFRAPAAAARWPQDSSLLLTSIDLIRDSFAALSQDAALSFFDLESKQWRPGAVELGVGRVDEFVVESEGQVFAIMAGVGRILRIRPQ